LKTNPIANFKEIILRFNFEFRKFIHAIGAETLTLLLIYTEFKIEDIIIEN